jgi:hypothetical protein
MMLAVTETSEFGGGRLPLPADTTRPTKMQITLLVARSTTLVLLKHTSAGATREDTCSTLSFGVSLQEHVLLTPRLCSKGRNGIRSGVFAGR